jgi:hypothetical protein
MCLFQQDRFEEALAESERSLAGEDESPFPWAVRIALLTALDRMQEARSAVKRLKQLAPKATLTTIGAILVHSGPVDERPRLQLVDLLRQAGME